MINTQPDPTGTAGVWRQGGLNTQAQLDAYYKRLADLQGTDRAMRVAYADGEPTEADWAAANVTPEQRAKATAEDLQHSRDRAAFNLNGNMWLATVLGGGLAQGLLGAGAAAGGGSGEAPALVGGGAPGDSLFGSFVEPGAVTSVPQLTAAELGGTGLGTTSGAAGGLAGIAGNNPSAYVAGSSTPAGIVGNNPSAYIAGGGSDSGAVGSAVGAASQYGGVNAATGGGMDWTDLLSAKNITSLLGMAAGAANSGSTATTTSNKDPWGPAQDFIKQQIANGQLLSNYYQQNPFNAQQKAGMNNTLIGADNFSQNIMPGLMNFANGAMGSQYQRKTGGAPGSGAGYGGAVVPGGMSRPTTGPFVAPQNQAFGLLDFNAINPYNGLLSGAK